MSNPLAHAIPDLAAAEHSAEGAALNPQGIRALHRDRGVVIPAAVGIVDLAGPFRVLRLHVDQDSLAALHRKAAEVLAAWLDANLALVVFGVPNTDRRRGGLNGRRGDRGWRGG